MSTPVFWIFRAVVCPVGAFTAAEVEVAASRIGKLILVSEIPAPADPSLAQTLVLKAFEQMNEIADMSPVLKVRPTLSYIEATNADRALLDVCRKDLPLTYFVQSGGPDRLVTVVPSEEFSMIFLNGEIVLI